MDQDDVATEDRKPFDNEAVKEEEDLQPEPDEILSMDAGCGRVWSVKVVLQTLCTLKVTEFRRTDPKASHGEMVSNR